LKPLRFTSYNLCLWYYSWNQYNTHGSLDWIEIMMSAAKSCY